MVDWVDDVEDAEYVTVVIAVAITFDTMLVEIAEYIYSARSLGGVIECPKQAKYL